MLITQELPSIILGARYVTLLQSIMNARIQRHPGSIHRNMSRVMAKGPRVRDAPTHFHISTFVAFFQVQVEFNVAKLQ